MKKHNFNAGPSILADEVIQNAAKAIVDFNGSGLSLLSISHRTKDFENVMAEADALFRELLGIPDNYKIFYIGGGASTFFYEVPANFLGRKAAAADGNGIARRKTAFDNPAQRAPDPVRRAFVKTVHRQLIYPHYDPSKKSVFYYHSTAFQKNKRSGSQSFCNHFVIINRISCAKITKNKNISFIIYN